MSLWKDVLKTCVLVGLDNAQDIANVTITPWATRSATKMISEYIGKPVSRWVLSSLMSRRGIDGIILAGINVINNSGAKFALRKGLPNENQRVLAVENEPHVLDGFSGKIPSGYGAGTKKLLYKGPAILKVKGKQTVTEIEYHVHDANRAGLHYDLAVRGLEEETPQFELNIPRGPVKGRFAFNATDKGIVVQQMKDRGLSLPKPVYKLKAEEILPDLDLSEFVVERKVDGSLANIFIRENRAIIHSHRPQASSYYDKLPSLEFVSNDSRYYLSRLFFPHPSLNNTVLKGEIVHPEGSSIVSGILNSSADNARRVQGKIGNVKVELWDIAKLRGKDASKLSYGRRRELLEHVVQDIRVFNTNYSVVDKCPLGMNPNEFYNAILDDPRGLPWSEGIVIKAINDSSGEPWLKVKRHDLHDMKIIGYEESFNGRLNGTLKSVTAQDLETGKVVTVGTGFSDFERDWIWDNRDLLNEPIIKVKVFKETDKSFHGPRFIEFHESKGDETGLLMYADVLSGLSGRSDMLRTKHALINAK